MTTPTFTTLINRFGKAERLVFGMKTTAFDDIIFQSTKGWADVQYKVSRGLYEIGTFRQMAENLSFWGNARTVIMEEFALNYYKSIIEIFIYEQNTTTQVYSLLFHGKLDLSKFEDDIRYFKTEIIDYSLINYININKDIEYDIHYNEMLLDVGDEILQVGGANIQYQGIGKFQTALGDAYGYADTSIYVANKYFKPTINWTTHEYDGTARIFNQPYENDYDPLYPIDPTTGVLFSVDTETLATLNIDGQVFYNGVPQTTLTEFKVGIVEFDGGTLTTTLIDDSMILNKRFNQSVTFTARANCMYSVIIFYTDLPANPSSPLLEVNFYKCFITSYIPLTTFKNLSSMRLPQLIQLMLWKISDNKYYKVSGLDDYTFYRITSGAWLRGYSGVSLVDNNVYDYVFKPKVKLSDLLDLMSSLGFGWTVLEDEIVFKKKNNFFDNTATQIELGEVKELTQSAWLDYYYNSITVGYDKFDTDVNTKNYDIFQKRTYKSEDTTTDNSLEIVPAISANAFEIDYKVYQDSNGNRDYDKFEGDDKLYLLVCESYEGLSITGQLKRDYDMDEMPYFPASIRIFNLEVSPARLFLLNSMFLDASQQYKMTASLFNFNFYSRLSTETVNVNESETMDNAVNPFIERTFEHVQYNYKYPTADINFADMLTNSSKMITFVFRNVKYYCFIDECEKNISKDQEVSWKCIKAKIS